MSYTEQEQFLGRGDEKFFWVLSLKNIAGLAGGLLLGQRLGGLVWGHGVAALATTAVCMALGILLTLQYHGLIVARRLLIRSRFVLRRVRGPEIDGLQFGGEELAPSAVDGRNERVRVRMADDRKPILLTGVALPAEACAHAISQAEPGDREGVVSPELKVGGTL